VALSASARDIVKMAQAGVDESVLIAYVQKNQAPFGLTATATVTVTVTAITIPKTEGVSHSAGRDAAQGSGAGESLIRHKQGGYGMMATGNDWSDSKVTGGIVIGTPSTGMVSLIISDFAGKLHVLSAIAVLMLVTLVGVSAQ
jgi:hypothetical protein